jgi:hypothetical protein
VELYLHLPTSVPVVVFIKADEQIGLTAVDIKGKGLTLRPNMREFNPFV